MDFQSLIYFLLSFFCLCHGSVFIINTNTSYPCVRTGFGSYGFHFNATLIDAFPQSGCTALRNIDVRGKVVILALGGCYPQDKALNVQNAGAIGVIIESYAVYGTLAYFTNGEDNEEIQIPCLEISSKSYGDITSYLKLNETNVVATLSPGY